MPSSPNYKRNYKQEYATAKKRKEVASGSGGDNAMRKKARRIMEKKGAVKKNDGKDVDHRNRNPKDNRKGNLRAVSKTSNRSFSRKPKGK